MLATVQTVWAQEPADEQAPPTTEAAAAEGAERQPAAEPATEMPAAEPPAVAAEFDYTRLAHPDVADQLQLSDEQRASLARLLNERAEAVAEAADDQREQIAKASDAQLAALLTVSQRAKLAELATTQKLRFNFRDQKWVDVLDWFALQAGLTLVMDQPPPGNFTFSDDNSYTPTQAIDLLNSILLTKGFTLIRRDRLLMLVNLSNGLPMDLIPTVEVEQLPQRGSFEIVTANFPLEGRPADTVTKEIEPLLGNYGVSLAMPATGRVMVTETAGMLRRISIVIASIPRPKAPEKPKKPEPPPPPVLTVYPVKAIDLEATVATLTQLFANAKFTYDTKVDQIMAFATPSEHAGIKAALDQMMANDPPEKKARLDTYPLATLNTDQLLEQLAVVVPDAQVSVDPVEKRLFVFGDPSAQETVQTVLDKLYPTVDVGDRKVSVYRLLRSEPATLASIVEELFPRARVTVEEAKRRVVIDATASEHEQIKSLVTQLEEAAPEGDRPTHQIYPLDRKLDATAIAALQAVAPDAEITAAEDGKRVVVVARPDQQVIVKAMLDQLLEAAGDPPQLQTYALEQPLDTTVLATLQALVPAAQVSVSADARQLIVVATPEDQTTVAGTLQQIQASAATTKAVLETYHVEGMTAAQLQTILQPQVKTATITVDAPQERLIVWGPQDEQDALATLVAQLKEDPLTSTKPELRFYPLAEHLHQNAITVLADLTPSAKVTWQADTKRLMVVAPPRDQQAVQQTIEQLAQNAPPREDPVMISYEIEHASAESVFEMLQDVYPDVKLILDAKAGRIVARAALEQQALIKQSIAQLDAQGQPDLEQSLKLYSTEQVSPATLLPTLQELVPEMRLTADAQNGRIAAWGTARDHATLQKAFDQFLRGDPAQRPIVRAYPVPGQAPAGLAQIGRVLEQVVPQAVYAIDTRGGGILASAREADHAEIKIALEQLVEMDRLSQHTLESYELDAINATQAIAPLKAMVPTAVITPGVEPQHIIVWAVPEDHQRIVEVIQKIEQTRGEDGSRKLQMHRVHPQAAARLTAAIAATLPDLQILDGQDTGQLLVWATDKNHTRLDQLVQQLEAELGVAVERDIVVYDLEDVTVADAQRVLAETVSDIEFLTTTAADRLVVRATAEDHEQVKSVL